MLEKLPLNVPQCLNHLFSYHCFDILVKNVFNKIKKKQQSRTPIMKLNRKITDLISFYTEFSLPTSFPQTACVCATCVPLSKHFIPLSGMESNFSVQQPHRLQKSNMVRLFPDVY